MVPYCRYHSQFSKPCTLAPLGPPTAHTHSFTELFHILGLQILSLLPIYFSLTAAHNLISALR